MLAKVGIAKAVDRPFAPAEDLQEQSVGLGQGVESTKPIAVLADWLAEVLDRGGQGLSALSAGQCFQVTAIGGPTDFGPTGHVRDGASQTLPAPGWVGELGSHTGGEGFVGQLERGFLVARHG